MQRCLYSATQAWDPVVSKDPLRHTRLLHYLLPSNFKLELFKQTLIELSPGPKANLK